MHVDVNRERCQGHARCNALCPEVFELDDIGFALPLRQRAVQVQFEDKARRAANNCPEHAITVSD